jgi:hypothetical protein
MFVLRWLGKMPTVTITNGERFRRDLLREIEAGGPNGPRADGALQDDIRRCREVIEYAR